MSTFSLESEDSPLLRSGPDSEQSPSAKSTDTAKKCSPKISGQWPTPTAVERIRSDETMQKCAEFRKRNAGQNSVPIYLAEAVKLFPSPMPSDAMGGRTTKGKDRQNEHG